MKIFQKFKEYYIKIVNSNSTPHGIALAVSVGFFIGFFLPIGTQTIPAILIAFVLRIDKLLTFAATWICNPYTVPFLYPFFCFTGAKVVGFNLSLSQIERDILSICRDFSWVELKDMGFELGVSFFVGSFIYGVITAVIGYVLVKYLIIRYRNRKKQLC